MNKADAQLLVEKIMKEASPGTTAVVRQEEILVLENDSCYIIDVYENGLIRLCLRTEEQWESQKKMVQEMEIQAIIRSLVKQLDQELERASEVLPEYVKWFIERLDYLSSLASNEETEKQLHLARQTMREAMEKLQGEETRAEFYPTARTALQFMKAVIKRPV